MNDVMVAMVPIPLPAGNLSLTISRAFSTEASLVTSSGSVHSLEEQREDNSVAFSVE